MSIFFMHDLSLIRSFPPVADENCRLLILGSMPGKRSLEEQAYYAHPQNAFWRIMAAALEQALPEDFPARYRMLLSAGIALWDVCASCQREGSLDSNIRNALPNDIPGLLAQCPRIEAIACNGQTSYTLLRRHFPSLDKRILALPSTSPAYTKPFSEKLAAWAEIVQSLR